MTEAGMNSSGFLGGGKEESRGAWGLREGRLEKWLMTSANTLHFPALI